MEIQIKFKLKADPRNKEIYMIEVWAVILDLI
jgi:hypothetical protein